MYRERKLVFPTIELTSICCASKVTAFHDKLIYDFLLVFAYFYHGGIGQAAQMCSNGIAGVEGSDACCVADCGTCGGSGCGSRARAAGLTADDCCIGRIRDANVFCDDSGTAPCLVSTGEGFGQSWLTMTYFIAREAVFICIALM